MDPRTLYLIKRAEIEVTSRMSKALEPYEITPVQFTILYFVDFDKGDLSSAQLSRRFSMKPQSMNELVRVLERKKLLKKSVNPSHARILHLQLTAKGKKLLADCNTALDVMEGTLFEGLSHTEIQIFRNLIGRIIDTSQKAKKVDILVSE